jgi:hypothetical protein
LAVSTTGELRAYDMVDLRTWVSDPGWTTLLNLRSTREHVRGVNDLEFVDFCCPYEVIIAFQGSML